MRVLKYFPLLDAKSIYVTYQRAKGVAEVTNSCCRSHIEMLKVYRAVDKNNLVCIDDPGHRCIFTYNFNACICKCVFA